MYTRVQEPEVTGRLCGGGGREGGRAAQGTGLPAASSGRAAPSPAPRLAPLSPEKHLAGGSGATRCVWQEDRMGEVGISPRDNIVINRCLIGPFVKRRTCLKVSGAK